MSKPSVIRENESSELSPLQSPSEPPAAFLDSHSSQAPLGQATGMASTTMEATQLVPTLLPHLNSGLAPPLLHTYKFKHTSPTTITPPYNIPYCTHIRSGFLRRMVTMVAQNLWRICNGYSRACLRLYTAPPFFLLGILPVGTPSAVVLS